MQVMSGPVRYFYLRNARGPEDVHNWPPAIKPLEGPDNKVFTIVRLYADAAGWRAEGGDDAGNQPLDGVPPLVLTRRTVLGLLQEGKRTRADVGLLGVRVVNLNAKGVEYVTHLVVHALSGSGTGISRAPMVVPIEAMVLSEYLEHGSHAEAQLDLRLSPTEYASMPAFLPDDIILRGARQAINETFQSTARFYTYANIAKHGISLEVEAGRVSLHGRVDLDTAGEQARAALLATPGVVEVADHLLYLEDLKDQVEHALDAKGIENVAVLVEHALVVLRGEAPDSKTRYQAEDIARGIPGVRGVVNDIVVTSLQAAEK
ncbi:MAG TPA: BON domain-containing protein [Ktedonobacterales bacterium]|nr:BON domain-containing protein [Ktedonobacterales bacterium]